MTTRIATALALLLGALPLAAQDKNVPIKLSDAKPAEMAEDVEILRLLLNKSFGLPRKSNESYPVEINIPALPNTSIVPTSPAGGDFNPIAHGNAWRHLTYPTPAPVSESFDGVHLKGHGIAYTIRLSPQTTARLVPQEKSAALAAMCQNCHGPDAAAKFNLVSPVPAAKPATDWEKARDELRGVPAPATDPNAAKPNVANVCLPGNLSETIVKLLAANGRHLRHLPGDESVTVVVTYDGVTAAAHDLRSTTLADPTLWQPKLDPDLSTKFGLTPEESKQMVLGDLHLKQGKHAEAIKAYETALSRYSSASVTIAQPKGTRYADLEPALKDLRSNIGASHRSLAQAYLAAGKLEEAKRAIELAQKLEIKLEGADKKTATTPVPAKIILSAKKAHLDKAESLSPVEFRKGVTVETVGLAAIKK